MPDSPADILEAFKAYCAVQETTVHAPRREAAVEAQAHRDQESGAAFEDLQLK